MQQPRPASGAVCCPRGVCLLAGLGCVLITQTVIAVVVVAARGWIATLLTGRPDVRAETVRVLPAVAACFIGGVS